MAILTQSGRTALAKSIAIQPIYMGWGKGQSEWGESPPQESITSDKLFDAVGYRQATTVAYCQLADDGDIELATGRFKLSALPTNHLYFKFNYDFEDALGETLKEVSVMVGTEPLDNSPAGQKYFTPEQVKSTGTLLLLEHRRPLFRDQGVRESFEFVVSF